MRAFRFSLRRVLDWRAKQLEIEEERLRRLTAAREELVLAAARLQLVKSRAEQTVREAQAVEAGDLWALSSYRERINRELQLLAERRRKCEEQIAGQQKKVVEAQRQCRLLEKLERQRHAEWEAEVSRELESVAAESFLAVWNRRDRC